MILLTGNIDEEYPYESTSFDLPPVSKDNTCESAYGFR